MLPRIAQNRKRPRGFTAVELLTFVLLLGILAAFAIPAISPVVLRYRLKGAAWQLGGDLRLARQRAVTLRQRFRICVTNPNCAISVPAGSYSIERDGGLGFVSDTGAPVRLPQDVTIDASANPVFYPSGMTATTSTFTLSNSIGSYQLTVAITGRVHVCEGTCPP